MGQSETKWLKRGCLGCLGIVGLAAVVMTVLVLLPLLAGRPAPEPVERQLTHELPPPPPPPDEPSLAGVELPLEAPPGALHLHLDLSAGSFHIEPGPPDQPLRVEADYDAGAFELNEDYDEGSNTYRVRFRPQSGWFNLFHRQVGDGEVRVIIPRGQPVALEAEIGLGESRVELGGLWLTAVEFDLGPGEHRLDISEPLSQPLPRFALDASVGETQVRSLGNASPAEVVIHQGVGEMGLDLAGAWKHDARVDIELGIGECRVRLPEGVQVDVERSRVGLGEATTGSRAHAEAVPEGAPTLTLAASGGIGELRIE